MSFPRILAALACAASLCLLNSCGSGSGRIDATNPTVAEMDQMDVQWGLQPRRNRGGPRRSYVAPSPMPGSAPAVSTQPTPPATIPTEPPAGR